MFSFDKIQLLIQHRRYQEAEREIRSALATDPMNAGLHMLLAICLINEANPNRLAEAKSEAQQAIGLEPDEPEFHYVLAMVLEERREYQEARKVLHGALQLDPSMAKCWARLASIDLLEGNWKDALDSAQKCLQFDPENSDARNIRTIALERLGRGSEALQSARESLREDPDDSNSQAAAGFAALNTGKYEQAQIHFREALRLDPNNEFAKTGMVSALCNRYIFFRLFYRFNVWLSRFAEKYQFMLLFAIFLLPRALGAFANAENGLGILVLVVRGLLLGIIILSWLIEPLTHLALRFNSFGKYLLSPKEIWCSNLVASYVAAAVVGVVYAFVRGPALLAFFIVGYWLICLTVTVIAFEQRTKLRTQIATVVAAAIALLPVYGLLLSYWENSLSVAVSYIRIAGIAAFVAQVLNAIDTIRNRHA